MDRISGLPDEILCHTLSFLSTKEAALTSLLSKRWRNQFAYSPNLCFEQVCVSGRRFLDVTKSFSDFVDKVLAVSGDSPLKKFSLKYPYHVESARIKLWISNVLSRGVLDRFHLDVYGNMTSLPLKVFTCKTLVELKLGREFVVPILPENASLPALKTLFLDCIQLYNDHDCAFESLISACHVLEELLIRGKRLKLWKWCRTVSCTTLQRLTINCKWYDDAEGAYRSDFRSLTLDTPSLAYLEYSGFVPNEYPIVNLDSLVEAKLDLDKRRMDPNRSNPTNLIKGLRNVEILNLTNGATSEVFYSYNEAIPLLENMSRLSIATDIYRGNFCHYCLKSLQI